MALEKPIGEGSEGEESDASNRGGSKRMKVYRIRSVPVMSADVNIHIRHLLRSGTNDCLD